MDLKSSFMRGALAFIAVLALLATTVAIGGRAGQQQNADAEAEQNLHAQHGAVEAMSGSHHEHGGGHFTLTTTRPLTDEDGRRAASVVKTLRTALEKYKDSNVAAKDGYRPFLPHLALPEYHFTNYRQAFVEAFTFDPIRPTSLLYRKTASGYVLVGAMYTAPKRFTEDQLHARIPLSVATWHAHVNICMPGRADRSPDWARFGPRGTISTPNDCAAVDGRFFPQLFGWMVHVYPFEPDPARIWSHDSPR
jgi:hypothetical protein